MKKKSKLELDLLALLEEDSTLTDEEMAMMLNSDAKSVREAIENLEKDKSIVKYIAVVNRENLDDDKVEALIELKVTPQRDIGYDDIAKRIYRYSEIKGVYLMAGAYDLAVRMESDSIKNISKFVFEKLAVIDGVTSTQTVFIMRKYKENGVVLVPEEHEDRLVVTP
ncbi:MAG: Lrp/AsnC family transcriptional regulator [Christensenellaceae bacterium]|nr:Lrp/AsnC family transcriptional regulator [Christensenellaceae bacterium]